MALRPDVPSTESSDVVILQKRTAIVKPILHLGPERYKINAWMK